MTILALIRADGPSIFFRCMQAVGPSEQTASLRIMTSSARILGELEPFDAATDGEGFEVLM